MADKDFTENQLNDAENSQWVFHEVNNLTVYTNHLDFPIQANVVDARTNRTTGALDVATDQNACFFYCLAAHKNPQKIKRNINRAVRAPLYLKAEMKRLYRRYTQTPLEVFPGVTMSDMDSIEQKFEVGVQIYTKKTQTTPKAGLISFDARTQITQT